MRIGLLAPPWVPVPPDRYGGTEAVIDGLARGLVAQGHDVMLWTTGDATCPVPRDHVYATAQPDRMGNDVVEVHHVIAGYETLIEWGADIVHDHTVVGPLYAQRHPALPVVTTNHGPFDAPLAELYRVVSERVPVVALSDDHARRAGDVSVAKVIHHGLDLDRFPVGSGLGDADGPYVAFLGRMAPEKGARRAVLAAREAGVRLVLAAKMREPLEHAFFTEQVQPLLGPTATYIGEVGPSEKAALLGAASALINPIRWPEPFGLVMIESLACGTPVLAFHEGSAPELVEHGVTGLLCDDVDDMADAVHQVGELDRGACRSAAERRFTLERMVSEHVDLYEKVVAAW